MNRHFRLALAGAVVAGAFLLLLAVFAVAEALNKGEIAPNVTAAGVPIGGLSPDDAREQLVLQERLLRETPAPFTVLESEVELDPGVVGLDIDVDGAVAAAVEVRRAGGFFDRFAEWVRSFTTTVEVPTDITWNEEALEGVFSSWEATAIGEPAREGGVTVVDGVVEPVYPLAGVGLDRTEARRLVAASLIVADRTRQVIPTDALVPRVTDDDVDEAVVDARRLLDRPVTLTAEDPDLTVEFDVGTLGAALRSRVPDAEPAAIELGFDPDVIADFLEPRRDEIEQPPRDAGFLVQSDGSVTLREARHGKVLEVALVVDTLARVAAGPNRGSFPFARGDRPGFTTAEARAMEPISQVSTFSTDYSCCEPRVTNIQAIASAVNDTVVMPGETFSLNNHVGPRTEEKGYVMAPMILGGEFIDAFGGGVSQFATTFYNTVFFGCYDIIDHTPHSYYFSRYPEGREATISWPTPDLVFRNDTDALILIKAFASDNTVSVSFYGNNAGRECGSDLSERRDFTEPTTEYLADPAVTPGTEIFDTTGSQGWTVDVTRTIAYGNGDTSEETWTHTYKAIPNVIKVHPCNMPGAEEACPVPVPGVVGLTFSEAQAALDAAGLAIGDGGTVEVESESQDGLVQTQSTAPGEYVAPGTVVTVVVGSYTAPPTTTNPPPTSQPPPTEPPPGTTPP